METVLASSCLTQDTQTLVHYFRPRFIPSWVGKDAVICLPSVYLLCCLKSPPPAPSRRLRKYPHFINQFICYTRYAMFVYIIGFRRDCTTITQFFNLDRVEYNVNMVSTSQENDLKFYITSYLYL